MKKFKIIFIVLVLVIIIWYLNIKLISNTKINIVNNKVKNDIKIVQISDLHGMSFGINNSKIINKIEKINPDFIVVTGDMYTAKDINGMKIALNLFKELSNKYMVYSVNGEHDNNEKFEEQLKEIGIHILDYKKEEINVKETKINLYGITNVYYSNTFDLKNEFDLNKEEYNILLAHISNIDAFEKFGIDLAICGDTHGGQIRLPFIGAIYNRKIWFPELKNSLDDVYCTKGLYTINKMNLVVSSGLGSYPIKIRTFNLPEIVTITLSPK